METRTREHAPMVTDTVTRAPSKRGRWGEVIGRSGALDGAGGSMVVRWALRRSQRGSVRRVAFGGRLCATNDGCPHRRGATEAGGWFSTGGWAATVGPGAAISGRSKLALIPVSSITGYMGGQQLLASAAMMRCRAAPDRHADGRGELHLAAAPSQRRAADCVGERGREGGGRASASRGQAKAGRAMPGAGWSALGGPGTEEAAGREATGLRRRVKQSAEPVGGCVDGRAPSRKRGATHVAVGTPPGTSITLPPSPLPSSLGPARPAGGRAWQRAAALAVRLSSLAPPLSQLGVMQ